MKTKLLIYFAILALFFYKKKTKKKQKLNLFHAYMYRYMINSVVLKVLLRGSFWLYK